MLRPFNAQKGSTQFVLVDMTSQFISINPSSTSVRIINDGNEICYIRIGKGPQIAIKNEDTPILQDGHELIVSKAEGEDTLACISDGNAAIYVQTGEGGI